MLKISHRCRIFKHTLCVTWQVLILLCRETALLHDQIQQHNESVDIHYAIEYEGQLIVDQLNNEEFFGNHR